MSLKGSLQTVALPEVLDFLSGTGKTGELRVDGAGTEGLIWFEEGAIAGVRVRRSPNPVEAVFQLLRIEEGDFSFDAGESRPEDVAGVDRSEGAVSQVLEQAQDRLRQWSEIVSVVPSLDHRITLAASAPGDAISLDRSQWELVVAIGEGHSVGHVLAARDLGEFEGCQAVKGLIEASLVELGEPEATPEEPAAHFDENPAVEDESAAADQAASDVAEEPVAEVQDEHAGNGHEPGTFSSFGAFDTFSSNGHFALEEPVAETAEAADPAGAESQIESGLSYYANGSDHAGGETDLTTEEPTTDEPASENAVDRYASLRSVMAEVGQSLDDDPYISSSSDEDAAMPAFGSPLPYPVLGSHDDHDQAAVEPGDEPTDGHAALQALLAEVADEEPTPGTEEPVDGLADRGPWTHNELASFDGWRDEENPAATADQSPTLQDTFGQALSHNFASPEEAPAAAAVEDVEGSAAEHAEHEVEEEPAPVEEPINRGLLLKFLSSVRN